MPSIPYFDDDTIRSLGIDYPEILDALRAAFRLRAAGGAPIAVKGGIHGGDGGFFHAMPALYEDLAIVKWVASGSSPADGKYINAELIATDAVSGRTLAFMEFSWLTAMRTAAVSALGCAYLARPEASTLAILGCGLQARVHVEALAKVRPLTRVIAASRRIETATAFAEEVRKTGMEVDVARDLDDLYHADIILTAGPLDAPAVLDASRVSPGTLLLAVELARAWKPASLSAVGRWATDDLEHSAGMRAKGVIPAHMAFELDLAAMTGGDEPIWRADAVTAFVPPGIALADAVLARMVLDRLGLRAAKES